MANLRGHEVWGSAAGLQLLPWERLNSESKVNQLDVVAVINDDVLQLQVTVHDGLLSLVLGVHVLETLTQLFDEETSSVCRNGLVALVAHVLVERDPTYILLDEVDFFVGLEVIVDLADVRVLKLVHAGDLALHSLLLAGVIEFVLRIDLDGHSLFSLFVLSEFDLGVGALP